MKGGWAVWSSAEGILSHHWAEEGIQAGITEERTIPPTPSPAHMTAIRAEEECGGTERGRDGEHDEWHFSDFGAQITSNNLTCLLLLAEGRPLFWGNSTLDWKKAYIVYICCIFPACANSLLHVTCTYVFIHDSQSLGEEVLGSFNWVKVAIPQYRKRPGFKMLLK